MYTCSVTVHACSNIYMCLCIVYIAQSSNKNDYKNPFKTNSFIHIFNAKILTEQ